MEQYNKTIQKWLTWISQVIQKKGIESIEKGNSN